MHHRPTYVCLSLPPFEMMCATESVQSRWFLDSPNYRNCGCHRPFCRVHKEHVWWRHEIPMYAPSAPHTLGQRSLSNLAWNYFSLVLELLNNE